ncbi:hypothetical protein B0H16DRAFT_451299 [Mycena metata]|uniref:Uncharacterized protein n=1 Tax=Mycena metata TaxID=1033252 RepID=A0AAD7HBX4_9AGAR|nr:hypothetical protein B0H16DRAFT_451299 [Mycena metata]
MPVTVLFWPPSFLVDHGDAGGCYRGERGSVGCTGFFLPLTFLFIYSVLVCGRAGERVGRQGFVLESKRCLSSVRGRYCSDRRERALCCSRRGRMLSGDEESGCGAGGDWERVRRCGYGGGECRRALHSHSHSCFTSHSRCPGEETSWRRVVCGSVRRRGALYDGGTRAGARGGPSHALPSGIPGRDCDCSVGGDSVRHYQAVGDCEGTHVAFSGAGGRRGIPTPTRYLWCRVICGVAWLW